MPVPDIAVFGKSLLIVDGDLEPQTADDTDYGEVDVAGDESVIQTFTVKNTGNAPLTLKGLSITQASVPTEIFEGVFVNLPADGFGDFSKELVFANDTVVPGLQELTFQIKFNPSTSGNRYAKITIESDDPDQEKFYEFNLLGVGVQPDIAVGNNTGTPVIIPDGDDTPTAAELSEFGGTGLATGKIQRTFTVFNYSTAGVLNLTGAPKVLILPKPDGLGGELPGAGDFTVITQPGDSVAEATEELGGLITVPGTTTFMIEFDPSDFDDRTAIVSIASNDP